MMTRDEIRELAAFQADDTKRACAFSFYFSARSCCVSALISGRDRLRLRRKMMA